MRIAAFLYRLFTAGLFGAQLFFAAGAAQVVFSSEIAALPHADPRRVYAANAIGGMIERLDAATILGCALAVLCAVLLARSEGSGARRAALFPLLAGACAAASAFLITPAIHALRLANRTAEPAFARLHALSGLLLLLEMIFLLVAVARAPTGGPRSPA